MNPCLCEELISLSSRFLKLTLENAKSVAGCKSRLRVYSLSFPNMKIHFVHCMRVNKVNFLLELCNKTVSTIKAIIRKTC